MPRKTQNTFSLLRGMVRASWNKHNLFNLYKKKEVDLTNLTMFKQKWLSKMETRAYHGEFLTENRWKAMFRHKLAGVLPLKAMGDTEGMSTPISLQTYAVLEKRLDFVLFRSMFASSVRQARKFILSGHVKVNGIIMKHPGYTLEAGDVYSVEPDKVLEALGREKPSLRTSYKIDKEQVIRNNIFVTNAKEKDPEEVYEELVSRTNSRKLPDDIKLSTKTSISPQIVKIKDVEEIKAITTKSVFDGIVTLIRSSKKNTTRETFVNKFGSKAAPSCFRVYEAIAKNTTIVSDVSEANIANETLKIFPAPIMEDDKKVFPEISKQAANIKRLATKVKHIVREEVLDEYYRENPEGREQFLAQKFSRSLQLAKMPDWATVQEKGYYRVNLPNQSTPYGRQDPSKAYFTPWRVREFLAPFAILPKYLEISFETCHGIYLRDPVARPGESEVISPFSENIHNRAYMYYIRDGM